MLDKKNSLSEFLRFFIVLLIIVGGLRLYVATPFIVSGSSMDPNFASGEYIIVDQMSYRFGDPERGDIIIFRFPRNKSQFFIKRIIGLPEETVSIHDGKIYIKNNENAGGFLLNEPYIKQNITSGKTEITLGKKEYFVLGDNRNASFDSRSWGPVNKDLIIGRALIRLFPPNAIAVFPGK